RQGSAPATMISSEENPPPENPTPSLSAWLALALVVVLGGVLRLTWLDDIEYKADEAWTYRHAQAAGSTEPLSWVGMPSSAGPENPGMSLWAFVPLAWASNTPVGLARGVAWLSIASILLLIGFAVCCVPRSERESWLWAAALVSVNPLAVLHHRKIWPPCLLPLLIVLFLACWWYRRRPLAAFGWGVLGAIIGQIHLGAFFFTGGFALWSWLWQRGAAGSPGPCARPGDGAISTHPVSSVGRPQGSGLPGERQPALRGVAWKSWLAGSVLASLPLIPWFIHVTTISTQPHLTKFKLARALEFKYLTRWLTEPLGVGLDHALGNDYVDFLRQPLFAGQPSYLVAALHLVSLAAGAAIGLRAIGHLRSQRLNWRGIFLSRGSTTELLCNAAFWGYGLLLTISCLPIHRHYMIIVYPLEVMWLVHLALSPGGAAATATSARRLLATLVVSQSLLSASFLFYVHHKQTIDGDYGVAYGSQSR
ncbi:MAG TPA: hypothetical protein VF306_15610, partial [Pirellulales bacterium]